MNLSDFVFFALVAVLSLFAGLVTQRGSLCAVAAIEEVIQKKRWTRFNSFLHCSGWSMLLLGAFQYLGYSHPLLEAGGLNVIPGHDWILPIFGGALFGVGATINGSCAFGTVARLGSGDLSFALTLAAIAAGYGTLEFTLDTQPIASLSSNQQDNAAATWLLRAGLALMALLNLRELIHLRAWRAHVWSHGVWHPALAVWALMLCNISLLMLAGQWPGITTPISGYGAISWLVLVLLIAGAVLGGVTAERFSIVPIAVRPALRRVVGGYMMGVAVAIVPGGNTRLILVDLPSLHWHGAQAYAAMVIAIAVSLIFAGWFRKIQSEEK
ncbi:hypothetical protein SAMN04487965_0265 [Microbulbifer donghaiensis]|uniref:Uncharacterized protein n=1 Tax=Microbulbifer donghaiensis TaxID=494016 RepID=A0A1M4UW82_9GAMM|nr:YeeE/YedE thiosulfate transporter family protein [Microbulbifer donghaiensis]SHE60952.1 hypothetical protein SAMN04487965_0265 [Microbulbifer donghaiensis]